METVNILECSSKGDKRFSAFYANVSVFGKYTSIERHYQGSKKFYDKSITKAKGLDPDYLEINGIILDKKYLTPWYKLLWVKYLDQNADLVEYASGFDDFHDMFEGKRTVNCQANVIRQYIKEGRYSIMNEELIKEFLLILKNKGK